MAFDKYKQLVDRLSQKTLNKELTWKESAQANAFQVSFTNYSVSFSEQGAGPDYSIAIINSSGEVVDTFTDVDLDEGKGTAYFRKMGDLFQTARRQALGVDQAIDEILDDLGEPF
jgi:hypothetical protein